MVRIMALMAVLGALAGMQYINTPTRFNSCLEVLTRADRNVDTDVQISVSASSTASSTSAQIPRTVF